MPNHLATVGAHGAKQPVSVCFMLKGQGGGAAAGGLSTCWRFSLPIYARLHAISPLGRG